MFDGIVNFFKGVISRMFPTNDIKKVVGSDIAISSAMVGKIEEWAAMYKGNASWVDEQVKSLRLEKGVCREFANVCMNEMEAKVSNEKLDSIFKFSIRNLNEKLQNGLALGSFIIKPLGENKVEYIMADRFVPLNFDSQGRMTSVVFFEVKKVGEDYYTRFEQHKIDLKGLTITNKAFKSKRSDSVGNEIPLTYIDEWSHLPESVFYAGVTRPDFGYYRNPIDNDIDGSPCGVSIFDAAVDLIRKTDVQFGRLDWEFESGERVIHVDSTALQAQPVISDGKTNYKMPKLNDRLYKGLNLTAGTNEELYKEYSPAFRDLNLINGLNSYLRRIEFNTCLAYGDLSDVQDVEKTATEIRKAKKRKYDMVTAIQENIKECLDDLVYALAFYNAMSKSGYEFVCTFKDSVLTDEEAERKQDMADVAMGVMSQAEYRAKWYGETIEEAQKNLPAQAQVIE